MRLLIVLALLLAGCAEPVWHGAPDEAADAHGRGERDHGNAHAHPDAANGGAGHGGVGDGHGSADGRHGDPGAGHGAAGSDAGHAHGQYDPHKAPHAGDHGQPGMQRPAFAPASGSVPTAAQARDMPQVSMLRYIGDAELAKAAAAGDLAGNGSLDHPYVIAGLYVAGDLMLQDTDACIVVRENWIGGQLTLNWNGQCVHVHHNHIYDLRVNENIRRTGYATGGLLERNLIEYVGQLRHYDGEFRSNTVGPMPEGGPFDRVQETTPVLDADVLIANIDGFNQGLVHNNTFYGSVDLDFHGHHHGTGFYAPHSHFHGDPVEGREEHVHDHTARWTSVAFVDNRIIDQAGYGLRYEDRNHAGDDRVAKSEQEETLDEDHFHRTHVLIARNTVEGAGIWIDVFNADDARHNARNDGWLDLLDNVVHLQERGGPLETPVWNPTAGFRIEAAKESEMVVDGNHATFEPRPRGPLDLGRPPASVAYAVDRLSDARLVFQDNRAQGFETGLSASRFDRVDFIFEGNDFGDADAPTDFDKSVP